MTTKFPEFESIGLPCLGAMLEAYHKLQPKLKTIPEIKIALQQIWTDLPQTPCHLVLSTLRVLVTVLTILLQCFLSAVTSLSSASFIPVTSCISSIHFLLGRPLLLPSPNASIILFSSPSDRITCPKNP